MNLKNKVWDSVLDSVYTSFENSIDFKLNDYEYMVDLEIMNYEF
jgi:hypothetical protein